MNTLKKLLICFCFVGLLSWNVQLIEATGQYSDVSSDFWAAKEIDYLSDLKIITGYGNGQFGPQDSIKRADAAIIVARILDLDLENVNHPSFKDVSKDHYAYREIAAAVEKGIFQRAEKFNPNDYLKRGEMAKIIVKTFHLQSQIEVDFKDTNESHWAYEFIRALASNYITTGYADSTFKPDQNITRAEFSVLVTRAKEETFRPDINILPKKMNDTIYYPQLYGMANVDIQNQINTTFKNHAVGLLNYYNEIISWGIEAEDPMLEYYTVDSEYEIKYHQNNRLSIVSFDYEYTGGVHGLYWYTAHNFDLNTGELLQLPELFLEHTNYSMVINNEIKKQINILKQTDDYWELEPFYSIDQNTPNFYLTPIGIGIYFSLYEYTPYAYGIPEFIIPYSVFGGILK